MNRPHEPSAGALPILTNASGAVRRATCLAAALLATGLTQVPAAAQSVTTWGRATGLFQPCCSGLQGYDSDWVGGTGLPVAIAYYAGPFGVAIDAETGYGRMQAEYVNYADASDVSWARSNTEVQSASADRLVVRSDSLPVGTPISLEVTFSLNLWGSGQATATLGGLPDYFRFDVSDAGTRSRYVKVLLEDRLEVGSVMNLDYRFRSYAYSEAGYADQPDYDADAGHAETFLSLDVLCTACGGFGTLADGARLVYLAADSGHNYAPVPEPGTWALLIGGLAVVGGLRRRLTGDRS